MVNKTVCGQAGPAMGRKSSEGTYTDGEQDGMWTYWHENGQKSSEGTYTDGEQDGMWTYWHENGQKGAEGTYKDGEEDGMWTYWTEEGELEEHWFGVASFVAASPPGGEIGRERAYHGYL